MTKKRDRPGRIRQRLGTIPGELDQEVERMLQVRKMLAGYVYQSRRRCGKPGCRCARGELHESWVVATEVNGKKTTRSLGGGRRREVEHLAENYRRFRKAQRRMRRLCEEAMELSRELEGLICEEPFSGKGKR